MCKALALSHANDLLFLSEIRYQSEPVILAMKNVSSKSTGFTLVELLVSTVLLGALIYSSGYIISHLLFNSTIGLKQKGIDDWGRIDYLLETDIREATLAASGSIPGGASCGSSSSPELALLTPYSSSTAVTYYNTTDNGLPVIRRCGPDILEDGSLSASSSSDNIVMKNASIDVTTVDNSFVEYGITMPSGLSGVQTGFARLRSRSY